MELSSKIWDQLSKLERYIDLGELRRQVSVPAAYFPDEIVEILPSLNVSGGGIVLASLILSSNTFVCDIRVKGNKAHWDFDFIKHGTVVNYRFTKRTIEIREEETVKASFDVAKLILIYENHPTLGPTFDLDFAGDELGRFNWINQALKIFPFGLRSPNAEDVVGYIPQR